MTLELRRVVKRVGSETHIHDTSVRLVAGGFNILLGTTLAVAGIYSAGTPEQLAE